MRTDSASQTPKMIVPPAPMPMAMFPTMTVGAKRSVPSAVSVVRTATTSTQNRMMPAPYATADRTWRASTQSSKVTVPILRQAQFVCKPLGLTFGGV